MRHRSRRALFSFVAALSAAWSTPAFAGYYSLLHNNTDTNASTGNALVVAAPATDNGRIQIGRIRLSSSKSTSLSFQLRSARESSDLGDTKAMSGWSCTLPGCQEVFTLEGVKANNLYDLSGLQLQLQPGHRLYLYTDAAIGADYFTVEVWWNDR